MKMSQFQPLLLKAAVNLIACDGSIADIEITELKRIAENEIYFSEFDYNELLNDLVNNVRTSGKDAINNFLNEVGAAEMKERQKFIMIEVILKVMESDEKIESNELKFLQLVKSKLKLEDEQLIIHFPDKLEYLLENDVETFHTEFTDDIKFSENT